MFSNENITESKKVQEGGIPSLREIHVVKATFKRLKRIFMCNVQDRNKLILLKKKLKMKMKMKNSSFDLRNFRKEKFSGEETNDKLKQIMI